MKYLNYSILLNEIPGKVSLVFAMTGCPLKCEGCHSKELWDENNGNELTKESIKVILDKYKGLFDVVLFFGGEWNGIKFLNLLKYLKEENYSIGLYTGMDSRPEIYNKYLDYIKYGSYKKELGGLESKITNQRLIYIPEEKDITDEFWKDYTISLTNNRPNILKMNTD